MKEFWQDIKCFFGFHIRYNTGNTSKNSSIVTYFYECTHCGHKWFENTIDSK